MELAGHLDFGSAVFGVDPATHRVGICLMLGDGTVVKTWRVEGEGSPLHKLSSIHGGVKRVFDALEKDDELRARMGGVVPMVAIEEGIFSNKRPDAPRVQGMLGEVRGIVFAEAWRHGWTVRKVYVQTWKAKLTKIERKMVKGSEYVRYWNERLGLNCTWADEVDAVMIAAAAL